MRKILLGMAKVSMARILLLVYLGCFVSSRRRRKDARKIADINFKPFTGMQRKYMNDHDMYLKTHLLCFTNGRGQYENKYQ